MEDFFDYKGLIEEKDFSFNNLENLRRNAYILSAQLKMESDSIVGIFGKNVSEKLIYSYGFIPLPIVSIDSFIFEYSVDFSYCDVINSTITYLKTKKCPLLFSSKFFVVDNSCMKFNQMLENNSDKDVILQENIKEYLDEKVKDIKSDNSKIDFLFNKINNLYKKLEKSDLKGNEIFNLKFFSKFIIDLEKRIDFLEESLEGTEEIHKDKKVYKCACPYGVSDKIGEKLLHEDYLIDFASENADFYYKNCFIAGDNIIGY